MEITSKPYLKLFRMPYRLLLYMVEIWRTILKDMDENEVSRKGFRLPVIVPCVLYNGSGRWTAATSFRETLAGHERFGDNIIDFTYILFDVNRYKDGDLLELANVIGSVFFMDKPESDTHRLVERLKVIADAVRDLPPAETEVLLRWIRNRLSKSIPDISNEQIDDIFLRERKVQDVIYNMELTIKKDREKALKEGRVEGMNKGSHEKSVEIAKKLVKKGYPIDDIVDVTGLTTEEIKRLEG